MPEMILTDMDCKPIIPVSINTLYLHDNLIHKKGLPNIIDSFIDRNDTFDKLTGKYKINELADFDDYLRKFPFNKSNDIEKWLHKVMKKSNS